MKCETYMLQNKQEIDAFASLLVRENVRSYLEIGSKFGGSFWRIVNRLPAGSKAVSVDLPQGDTSFKQTKSHLEECVSALKKKGYDTHLVLGDSTHPDVIDQVYKLAPFDAVFIDANHTLPYIKKDWENYSKIAKIVAMHDIGFYRQGGLPPHKKPIEVPIFWKEIKKTYKHSEIRSDPHDNGIGVIWI